MRDSLKDNRAILDDGNHNRLFLVMPGRYKDTLQRTNRTGFKVDGVNVMRIDNWDEQGEDRGPLRLRHAD